MTPEAALNLIFSILASVGTVIASLAVARKFRTLGGPEAQNEFNTLMTSLKEGYEEQAGLAQSKADRLEAQSALDQATIKELEKQAVADRRKIASLESDIRALHDELRVQRPRGKVDAP